MLLVTLQAVILRVLIIDFILDICTKEIIKFSHQHCLFIPFIYICTIPTLFIISYLSLHYTYVMHCNHHVIYDIHIIHL